MFNLCQDIHIIHEHHHYYHSGSERKLPMIAKEGLHRSMKYCSADQLKAQKTEIISSDSTYEQFYNSNQSQKPLRHRHSKGISLISKVEKNKAESQLRSRFEEKRQQDLEGNQSLHQKTIRISLQRPAEQIAFTVLRNNRKKSSFLAQTNQTAQGRAQISFPLNMRLHSSLRNKFTDNSKVKLNFFKQVNPQSSALGQKQCFQMPLQQGQNQINSAAVIQKITHSEFISGNSTVFMQNTTQIKTRQAEPIGMDNTNFLNQTRKVPLRYLKKSSLSDAVSIISRNMSQSCVEDTCCIEQSFVVDRSAVFFQPIGQIQFSRFWQMYLAADRGTNTLVSVKQYPAKYQTQYFAEVNAYKFVQKTATGVLQLHQVLMQTNAQISKHLLIKEPYQQTFYDRALQFLGQSPSYWTKVEFVAKAIRQVRQILHSLASSSDLCLDQGQAISIQDLVCCKNSLRLHSLFKLRRSTDKTTLLDKYPQKLRKLLCQVESVLQLR